MDSQPITAQSTTVGTQSTPSCIVPSAGFPVNKGVWVPWLVLASVMTALGYLYADSLRFILEAWLEDDNYSHGLFIPLISLYLIWLRWGSLQTAERRGAWWGLPIISAGLCVFVVGQFAAMHAVVHLSLWVVIVGFVTCVIGMSGVRLVTFPLVYLLTAIPIPVFLMGELSSRLQLWSSALAIKSLQLLGVMASREGNVIDLGRVQLQVVEACSGLRYLFPLMTLALLIAYFFRQALWKRLLLVLSSIPISILLNGFRIGAIGLLVDTYGRSAADGFSHFFEGWVFFVASLGLLYVEMSVLARIGSRGSHRPFAELFGSRPVASRDASSKPAAHQSATRIAMAPALAGGGLLILAALTAPAVATRDFPPPARESLLEFPLELGAWQGISSPMERQYLDALQLDDYVLADYRVTEKVPVNVYVAYYESPKKGLSSHSPRQCIPGGGWDISSFEPLRMTPGMNTPFDVNRVVIQKDGQKQIVYYWFKHRDRWITDEYLVKLYLFWDSLTRHRADGALVRLVSAVYPGETEAVVDGRLQTMVGLLSPLLPRYIPD